MQPEQQSNPESQGMICANQTCRSTDITAVREIDDNVWEVRCNECGAEWLTSEQVFEPQAPPPFVHENVVLDRIATALERIADAMEDERTEPFSHHIGPVLGSAKGSLPSMGQTEEEARRSVMSKFSFDAEKRHLKGQKYRAREE